jgi:hypothetical protein
MTILVYPFACLFGLALGWFAYDLQKLHSCPQRGGRRDHDLDGSDLLARGAQSRKRRVES